MPASDLLTTPPEEMQASHVHTDWLTPERARNVLGPLIVAQRPRTADAAAPQSARPKARDQ
ncbi:hypothetical protein AA105894_2528 [Asaia spathodeae NBRC 105894]|nr:hypothetical protein AA105894_2528 [Asaia spathodeae NBRC 105894]